MPTAKWTDEQALRVVSKALHKGAASVERWHTGPLEEGGVLRVRKPHSWKANYAGNCQNPITRFHTGRRLTKAGKSVHTVDVSKPHTVPRLVEMIVPCRKCEPCLRRRSQHWKMRAVVETGRAQRTWFGTVTLSPEQHFRVAAACRLRASQNGDDWDAFPLERQFKDRHECISREITLWVKRVRKASGASLRLLCVTEAHKSGLPHYHFLVHEEKGSPPVKHAVLSKKWRVGFSNFKLVDDPAKASSYATKTTGYLSKSMMARVRASLDYGSTT